MKKFVAAIAVLLLLSSFFIFGCPQPPNPPLNNTNGTVEPSEGNESNGTILPPENETNVTPPGCEENWACGEWSQCTWPQSQTRECVDLNSCGTANSKPNVEQECPYGKNTTPVVVINRTDRIWDTGIDYSLTPFGNMYIYAIDVGYGDAFLVKRGNFDMLIDAGSVAHGEVVVNFLNSLGVDDVDILVVTNHGLEHSGGAIEVINRMSVEEIWDNKVPAQNAVYQEFLSQAGDRKIPFKHPEAKQSVSHNGLNITVLNPQSQRYDNPASPGVDSIVLKVTNGNFCMVFMSDAEEGVQPQIMAEGIDLKCKIMKLAAHGSGNAASNSFIFAVQPDYVVIPVGPNSKGCPNPTTIESIRIKGISMYRTDVNGTGVIISDGINPYSIAKYKGS